MLNIYRRHADTCKYSKVDRPSEYTKCNCPIWCYGMVDGKEVRKSLQLRDWARATKRADEWEKDGKLQGGKTITNAIVDYLAECKARNVRESTLSSYSKTLGHLREFLGEKKPVDSITLEEMSKFRSGRKYLPLKKGSTERGIRPNTTVKETQTIRGFLNFCIERGWSTVNPAKKLKPPKDRGLPTMPFEPEEVNAILAACDSLQDGNPATRELTRLKARARILVMLYTGFRISDVVQLRRKDVDLETGRVRIQTQKTGSSQYVKLSADAVDALKAIPIVGPFFFWNGESRIHSAIGSARLSIARVLKTAGVKGHPHRFRDTFSVELLKGGADLRTVQLLLGHSSVKTTEKHYAPWVQAFQETLDRETSKLSFGNRTEKRTLIKRSTDEQ